MLSITLYFSGASSPELTRVETSSGNVTRISVRGKTEGASKAQGTFQWSSAVKSLAILLLRHCAQESNQTLDKDATLSGEKGSLACSLDYALSKQPLWLLDMFGTDSKGKNLLRTFLQISNSSLKYPGPVIIRVNEKRLPPEEITVFLEDQKIDCSNELATLARMISSGIRSKIELTQVKKTPPLEDNTYPFPFNDPFWFSILKKLFLHETLRTLEETDIFNTSTLQNALRFMETHEDFLYITGRRFALTDIIDRHLTSAQRLGMHPNDFLKRSLMPDSEPFRITLTPAHVGSLALLKYLTKEEKLPLDIDYHHFNTDDVLAFVSTQTHSTPPDAMILTVATAADLLRKGKKLQYRPLMVMPQNSYRVMSPASERGVCDAGIGDYFFISDNPSTSQFYFKELSRNGVLQKSKIKTHHIHQDEIPALFRNNVESLRTILWFPYDRFNQIFDSAMFLDCPAYSSYVNEILFIHESHFANPTRLLSLNILIRDAWLKLKSYPRLLEQTIDLLLDNPDYLSMLCRAGGLHNFTKSQIQAAKEKHRERSSCEDGILQNFLHNPRVAEQTFTA